ncbi:hypothetical protein QOT17_019518 [Balamuthia mandrillaris]
MTNRFSAAGLLAALALLLVVALLAGFPSGVDALRKRSPLHESLAPASLRPGRLGEDWHHVPRHKPGHLPKFGGRNQYRQLNDALQNDTMSDPFQSNHQLSKAKNFVAVNRFRKCVDHECGEQTDAVEVIVTEYRKLDGNNEYRFELPGTSQGYAVASPDFYGSLHTSLVVFYTSDTGCSRNAYMILDSKHDEFAAGQPPVKVTGCLGGVQNEVVRGVAWGNVNPTAAYELQTEELLVVTFVTAGSNMGRLTYKLYSRSESTDLLELESSLIINNVHAFNPNNKQGDVVVGDFDGDGLEEFACLYFTAADEATVDIILVDENMQLSVGSSFTFDFPAQTYGQMAAGHLFSSDWEELALLFGVKTQDSNSGFYLHHLKVDPEEGELEVGAPPVKLDGGKLHLNYMAMDIVVGDLNGDTRDEVAFTYSDDSSNPTNPFSWQVFLWAAQVEAAQIVPLTAEPLSNLRSLTVNDNSESMFASLAIGRFSQQEPIEAEGIFHEHIAVMGPMEIALFRWYQESALERMTLQGTVRRSSGQEANNELYNKEFLTGVYYATENVRLGKPRHWKYPKVLNIIASLRTPPRHYDIVDGVAYGVNVNPPNNFGYIAVKTSFESSGSTGSRFSVEYKRSWAAGAELNVYLGKVTVGLETTYGRNFENVNTQESIEVWSDLTEAVEDDALIRTEVVYDVWEYPVYSFNFTETEPTDYIVVIWPERLPDGSEDKRLHALGFKSPNSFVRPWNEVNNLFSYSANAPPNLGGRTLKSFTKKSFGGTTSLFEVTWEEIQEQSELTQTSFGVGASFGLDMVVETENGVEAFGNSAKTKGKWGFDLEVTGEYNSEDIQVSSMTISESTRIAIKLDNASPEGGLYPYEIKPYIFYDKDLGYLCVDYAVYLPTGTSQGTVSFWEKIYNKPDLTWNLPYRWDVLNNQPSDNKYFTKSLAVSNENPVAGENLVVLFHARDYSLIPAKNVVLRFFQGDFRNPANQFGEDLLLEEVWKEGFMGSINDTWREIQEPLDRCLYAWLDPDDEILEVHENDNVGYIILNTGLFSQNELVFCGDIIKDTFGFEIPPDSLTSAASKLLPSFLDWF